MTKTAKTIVESLCVDGAVLLIIVAGSWRYTLYWPKVFGANIAVDGKPSPASALYIDAGRKCGGVLVRRMASFEESYALGFGTCQNWRFVWRCENIGFSFVQGLAFSNHEQWAQGCMQENIGAADSSGKILSAPKNTRPRNEVFKARSVEFNADDGRDTPGEEDRASREEMRP